MQTSSETIHPLVLQYRANQQKTEDLFMRLVKNPLLFKIFLLQQLPMGFLAGLRVRSLTRERCEVTVPYKWLNKNPFRSTYFAVLAMAAEMSSGMLSMMGTHQSNPSVSVLVTGLEASFIKKATGLTTFTCNEGLIIRETIERAIITGEGQTCTVTSAGMSKDGQVEAIFKVTWSFKMRSK
ncbi:MAG: DUF4442 domain-containing protein [Chitinophagales bacterium]|nr:DUF4442 domain-containing protein [Chitinophagales bacterium]MDW8272929.1 DUF4442 domain-containing protein [Chitinophagales bacterium]